MLGRLPLLSVAFGLAGAAIIGTAEAESLDQKWASCQNQDQQVDYSVQVNSCTEIIDSNQANTKDMALAYVKRGDARRKGQQNDFAGAIADYSQAILLDQKSFDAFASRGYAYQYGPAPDFALAIADYSQAIALNPSYPWLFYNRGNAYLTGPQPNFERAIADYSQAVSMNPNYAYAFDNRGLAHQGGSHPDFAKAIADHSHAIALYPQFANAYANRSLAYLGGARPDFAAAIADSDKAAELQPNRADYQNIRCWARAIAGRDLRAARAACNLALQLAPDNADILDSRGTLSLREKRWQDAWDDFDAAIRGNPSSARYFFGRGIAALRMGQTVGANNDLARAKQIDADVGRSFVQIGVAP